MTHAGQDIYILYQYISREYIYLSISTSISMAMMFVCYGRRWLNNYYRVNSTMFCNLFNIQHLEYV